MRSCAFDEASRYNRPRRHESRCPRKLKSSFLASSTRVFVGWSVNPSLCIKASSHAFSAFGSL